MKALFFAFLMLASDLALASGKLTFKAVEKAGEKDPQYSTGLAIYHRFLPSVAYVGWVGGGNFPKHSQDDWLKTEQGVEAYLGAVGVGAGLTYQINPKTDNEQTTYYGSLSYQLW